MKHSVPFILLAGTRTGESSLVMHTLSPLWGRRSFITGISRKTPSSCFLPLSLLEGEVTENPRSELWRAGNLSCPEPLAGIRSNVHKNAMTMFMSEVLFRTLREGDGGDGRMYEWCRRSILTLDALESNYANYHLRFLLEYAGELGFSPMPEDLAPFAGNQFAVLSELLSSSPARAMLIPMSGAQRSAAASALLDYICHHAEMHPEIRSLKVLGELYR